VTGKELQYISFPSTLGWILISAVFKAICYVHFCGPEEPNSEEIRSILHTEFGRAQLERWEQSPLLGEAREAILTYLGDGTPPPHLPLDLTQGTPFQRDVWNALCKIPPGETRSYQQIAERIGRPRSARAVGQACGRNPIPILVPCHRVVATGGKLGGYSGGLHYKKALLAIEQQQSPRP
jgi:O-6-methylguanine DNA methyltransferase